MIRILIADDHHLIRDGIRGVLQLQPHIECVGEAATGREAVEAYHKLKPDIVLMDLSMPDLDGLEATLAIRVAAPDAKIIILTTYAGDVQALRALRAGASGYLLKSSLRQEMLNAIEIVHSGGRHVEPTVAQEIALHSVSAPLTDREGEVLALVARGTANKKIGFELSISEDTVKWHLKSIYSKLNVNDRTEAVTVALRRGFISL